MPPNLYFVTLTEIYKVFAHVTTDFVYFFAVLIIVHEQCIITILSKQLHININVFPDYVNSAHYGQYVEQLHEIPFFKDCESIKFLGGKIVKN